MNQTSEIKCNELYSNMLAENMSEKEQNIYRENLDSLIYSLKNQLIYNVDFKSINGSLGDLVWKHFKNVMREKNDLKKIKNDLVLDLYYKSIMSFHDIVSAKKKVDKIQDIDLNDAEKNYVKLYQELCNELVETALLLKEIKQYIVKGRKATSETEKPINENKVVKTCSCCFRKIAIDKQNKIVHHGFQRYGGFQSNSCFGQGFSAWEESDIGTVKYIVALNEQLDENQMLRDELSEKGSFVFDNKGKKQKVERGSDMFEKVYQSEMRKLDSEIRALRYNIDFLTKQLEERNMTK